MLERIARPLHPEGGRARVASSRAAIIALLGHGLKAALLSLALVGGLISTDAAYAQDAAKAESDLRQLRARIARLDREMASDSQTRKSLSKQIEASEKNLAQKASAARRAEQKLAEQKRERVKIKKKKLRASQSDTPEKQHSTGSDGKKVKKKKGHKSVDENDAAVDDDGDGPAGRYVAGAVGDGSVALHTSCRTHHARCVVGGCDASAGK